MKTQKAEDKVIDTWLETTDVPDNSPLLAVKQNRVAKTVGVAISSALFLAACSNGGVEVTATDVATEFARSQTPVVETYTPTFEPTATNTPEPTKAAPSMENLPTEWQGRIDRIETMTNMDGKTTRVVAIEKLSDEDLAAGKTPTLRTLEWDGSEWVSYTPQVGLVGLKKSYWDLEISDWTTKSDNLSGAELQKITAEPIYGKNNQEIKLGLVADFADVTLLCGDIIEVNHFDNGAKLFVIKVSRSNGDILLFQIGQITNIAADVVAAVFNQDAIDPSRLTDPLRFSDSLMRTQIQEFPQRLTPGQMVKYADLLAGTVPQRIVFGVSKRNSEIMANDSPVNRQAFISQYTQGEVFEAEGIGIDLFHFPVMTEAELNSLQ